MNEHESHEYQCTRPFFIDNGELDGKRPVEIFVLGYELAMMDQIMSSKIVWFDGPVHIDNKERIEWMANEKGLIPQWKFFPNDQSESWVHLRLDRKEEPKDV